MATSTLKVELIGDASSLNRALGQTQSNMKRLTRAAGLAGAAIFAGLGLAAKKGFDELSQHAEVMAQVEAGIKSTGGAANITADQINELSNALMLQSGVDDELIAQGASVLLTFRSIRNEVGKNNDVFNQATQAALDLSVRLDRDLKSSALLVGKALNNPTRSLLALTRAGVQFTKQQEDQIKALFESGHELEAQKMILKELQIEVGGSAAALGKTLPGQIAIAQESFRDLAGQLTLAVLPAFTVIVQKALEFSQFLQRNPKLAKAMVIALTALAAALITASVAQTILNVAVLANPYVAVAVAVIALAGAIAFLVTKVDFFRKHWQLLMLGLGAFPALVATVVKFVIRNFDTLVAAFNKVRAVGVAAFNAVKFAVMSFLSPIFTAINAVQTLIGWINKIPSIPFGGGGDPGPGSTGGRFPGAATGGDITRTGLALVHRGEHVTPARIANRGGGAALAGGGGSVQVIVLGGDRQAIRWFSDLMANYSRQNGGRTV